MKNKRQRDKKERARVRGLAKARRRRLEAAPKPTNNAPTDEGRLIQAMLRQHNLAPSLYKDYVAVVASRVIDWTGEAYDMKTPDGNPVGGPAALMHKRDLHKALGDELAARFWNPTLNRRVARRGPGDPRGQRQT